MLISVAKRFHTECYINNIVTHSSTRAPEIAWKEDCKVQANHTLFVSKYSITDKFLKRRQDRFINNWNKTHVFHFTFWLKRQKKRFSSLQKWSFPALTPTIEDGGIMLPCATSLDQNCRHVSHSFPVNDGEKYLNALISILFTFFEAKTRVRWG